MRSTAQAPRPASIGDALGFIFFVAMSAAVLLEVTGVDPLGLSPQGRTTEPATVRVAVQGWG